MIRMSGSVDIDAPPEAVYAFMADLRRLPEWQEGVHEVEVLTDGPLQVGTRFREVFKVAGRRLEATCEISRLDPNTRIDYRTISNGPIRYAGGFGIEPTGTGSRLSYESTSTTHGLARLLEPLWKLEAEREVTRELATIKRIVESSQQVRA